MAYQSAPEPPRLRERLLLPSASGRYFVVVEVEWEYVEPDLEESDLRQLGADELAEVGWKGEGELVAVKFDVDTFEAGLEELEAKIVTLGYAVAELYGGDPAA